MIQILYFDLGKITIWTKEGSHTEAKKSWQGKGVRLFLLLRPTPSHFRHYLIVVEMPIKFVKS